MVLRVLYAFLGYCAMPLRHLHYASAFFFKPSSLPKLRARWGRQRVPTQTGALWVHAASMGEVMALAPAVDAWRAREPLFFTCMTASGVATVKRLWGDAVPVTFFPCFGGHGNRVVAACMAGLQCAGRSDHVN